MNLKKILMLDDGDIGQTIQSITTKLKRFGIDISVDIINPQEYIFKSDFNGFFEIDFEKIKSKITEDHKNVKYDVVACDFSFSSQKLNGYQLIKWLINESKSSNFRFKNAKFVCYSGEEGKFKEYITQDREIIKLIKLNIHAFYNRDQLVDELSALIRKLASNFSLSSHFQNLLEQEPERVFKKVYPKFKGKTLKEIATEIEADSVSGLEFQKYMIELTYAHILELND